MRPKVRNSPGIMVAALLALAPGLAAAQSGPGTQPEPKPYAPCTKTPTEGDVAAAKGAFQAGSASFNEADYDRAITYWEDAYRRDCTAHLSLLNLARAYELNGQKEYAANALETFLERSPGHPEEATIRRRIDRLHEEAQPSASPDTREEKAAPLPAVAEPPATPVDQPKPRRPIVPLVVAGAGAAVAVVGTIVYIGARNDYAAAKDKCSNPDQCADPSVREQGNDARSRSQVSGWITVGGGAVLAGGLVWYFVQKPESTASAQRGFYAHVAPSLGAGYGGIDVSGRF